MRALVISGGGSKGAFGGGIAEYLIKECGGDYDLYVGSSTGSLLLTNLALGRVDVIKQLFTSVDQKDIFSINPFIIREKNGVKTVRINHFNTLKAFLFRRKTFGSSGNLKKLIEAAVKPEDMTELNKRGKEVIVSVSNLTTYQTEFKSSKKNSFEDFTDWIWASANYVPFMSLLEKNGCEYADGGFGSHTPIQAAIDNGATAIDVIILEPEEIKRNLPPSGSAFESLMRVFGYMTDQIYYNDLEIGRLKSTVRDVKIRYFYLPRVITDLPLVFDPKEMKAWWKEGFEYAQKVNPFCTILEAKS